MIIVEGRKECEIALAKKQKKPPLKLSNNLCPRCGKPGAGPYSRWVRNSRGKRYEPYQYFAHREGGRLRWCYLGKKKVLDNAAESAQPLSNTAEKLEVS